MTKIDKKICTLVLEASLGQNSEGELVQMDEEKAEALVNAGLARYAEENDINGGEEEPVEEELEPVANSARRIEARAKDAVVSGVAKALEQTKRLDPKPAFGKVAAQVKRNSFTHFGAFAACVAAAESGDYSAKRKIAESNKILTKGQMNEGTPADGGALVPQEWGNELFSRMYNENPILSRLTRYPMRTNVLNIPINNETSGSSGIVAYWVDEADPFTDSKGVFATDTLTLQKLAVLINVTEELLQDNTYALESFLRMWTPKKMTFLLNDSILNGGGNQANIVNAASTIAVTRDTANRILFNDIVNMYTRFYHENLDGAAWYVNPSAYGDLMKLAFPGASGTTPLFIPTTGFGTASVASAPAGTIYGRPVYFVEQLPALGSRGDIMFADLSQVACGFKDMDVASTNALYFNKYISSFRFVHRVDTVCLWQNPYTRADGTTSSPIVVLTGNSSSSA